MFPRHISHISHIRKVNALKVILIFLFKYQPILSPQINQDVAIAALFEMISFLHLAITLAVHCRRNFILSTYFCFANTSVSLCFSMSSKAILFTFLFYFFNIDIWCFQRTFYISTLYEVLQIIACCSLAVLRKALEIVHHPTSKSLGSWRRWQSSSLPRSCYQYK